MTTRWTKDDLKAKGLQMFAEGIYEKPAPKKLKYHNKKTVVDGIIFDSIKESKRYETLKLMEKAQEIFNLELQPVYHIEVNGHKICRYQSDFRYQRIKSGSIETVCEDVKGILTPVFKLKSKLMKAVFNIEILLT